MWNQIATTVLMLHLAASSASGQRKVLEICDTPFALGMSRAETLGKLSMGAWPELKRRIYEETMFSSNIVGLSAEMFGLPPTSKCSGTLQFVNGRVIAISKNLASFQDAPSLVKFLVAQLARSRPESATTGALMLVRSFAKSVQSGEITASRHNVEFSISNDLFLDVYLEEASGPGTNIGGASQVQLTLRNPMPSR